MSPKHQEAKREVKLPPKEMIVTRRKSAQQQRQLRNKDRSMTRITQLLKSPTTSKHPQKKSKLKAQKSPKKNELPSPISKKQIHDKYNMDKVRRSQVKKSWLKPRPNFKTVARTNKRKLCTPKKDIGEPSPVHKQKPPSPSHSVLSTDEYIRLIEEDSSLDDDDFMEILTCPSPVWWEDPPDEEYSDEVLLRRFATLEAPKEATAMKNTENELNDLPANTEEASSQKINLQGTLQISDCKFMRKRSKLEGILGNIKNKIGNNDLPQVSNENNCKANSNDFKKANKVEIPIVKATTDKAEEEILNVNLNDDEMLKNLENIAIPVEDTGNTPKSVSLDDVKMQGGEETAVCKDIKMNPLNDIPKNMPPLQRRPRLNEESPRSSNDFSASKTLFQTPTSQDLDTISDTNVKFLFEDDEEGKHKEELNETSQIILDKIKKFFQKDKRKKVDEDFKKEYITVYKIVSEDNNELQDCGNCDQIKINSFYKKKKGISRRRLEEDTDSRNSNTLLVPNSENVKYCFKCSSIFETKDCNYCKKSDEVISDCVFEMEEESGLNSQVDSKNLKHLCVMKKSS